MHLTYLVTPPLTPQASSGQVDIPSVDASFDDIPRPGRLLLVMGANFDLEYTELYLYPPLPEEAILEYQVKGRSCRFVYAWQWQV